MGPATPAGHGQGRAADDGSIVAMSPANRDSGRFPTQVAYPHRATIRTTISAAIALIPVVYVVTDEFGWSEIPWVASILAACAAITRVLSIPEVELWLQAYVPWLAASEYQPKHAKENENE